ncbi:hypothetical protein ACFL6K_02330 [Candidatus Latescibacterota bacterium]
MKNNSVVKSVAFFEFKRLSRSYSFRIFVFFAVIGLVLTDYFLFIRNNAFNTIRISSAIPFITFLFLNMFQTVVVLLLAADFIKTDNYCDYTESVYPRSMTNVEYIAGKFLGILALFFLFDICIGFITLIINAVFVPGAATAIPAYFLYLFVIILPSLVFAIGISIFLMALVKSQSLAFLLLSGYTVTAVFYLRNKAHSLFDLTSNHIIELHSDFTGFGNMRLILMHRGVYLMLGMGFVLFAVILFKRLPQSKFANRLSLGLACVLTCASIVLGIVYLNHFSDGITLRQQMAALNNRAANEFHITVTDCSLTLIHDGAEIDVEATVRILNATPKPLESYYFTLNPGLAVEDITLGEEPVPFTRDLHIIIVKPQRTLPPDAADTLVIRYRGTIDEEACYVDIDEDMRKLPYGNSFYNISKRYGFVAPDYVMLTPETLWYPVSGVPFGSIYPKAQKRDFVNFELTVTTKENLTALSQGKMRKDGAGTSVFTPENPLPHMSLVIGEYEMLSTVVDSIEYRAYVRPGHDYFSRLFTELQSEKLAEMISTEKNEFESSFGGTYPYPRLSIIEVPVQFYAYIRSWTGESQTVQPEMVFVPEKGYGINGSNFEEGLNGFYSDSFTLQDKQEDVLDRFISNLVNWVQYTEEPNQNINDLYQSFMIGDRAHYLSYGMFSQYTNFLYHVTSDEYPFISGMLENYVMYKSRGLYYSTNLRASLFLNDTSLSENLNDPSKNTLARLLLRAKSDEFFSIYETKIGEQELSETLKEFISSNMFKSCELDDLHEKIKQKYSINLKEDLESWYARKGLPGYVITDGVCYEIVHNNRTYHQVRFIIHNLEPVESYILVRGREYDSREWATYQTSLEGNQSKEIGMIFDSQPAEIEIHTFLSQNIPNIMNVTYKNIEWDGISPIFDGERIVEEQYIFEKPGEIIVDNEDDGFQIIKKNPRWQFLQSQFQPEDVQVEFPRTWSGFLSEEIEKWSYFLSGSFLGLYAKTAYIISGGNGQNKVQWTADIPEDGEYDLYCYTYYIDYQTLPSVIKRRYPHTENATAVGDYNFIIYHNNGVEQIKREISDYYQVHYPVEVYLGRYHFSKGSAKIELTDETDGLYVFADAVKWVKKD